MLTYTIISPYRSLVRKQLPAAVKCLKDEAWRCLAADGQLDTKAGHAFMTKVYQSADQAPFSIGGGVWTLPNGQLLTFRCRRTTTTKEEK